MTTTFSTCISIDVVILRKFYEIKKKNKTQNMKKLRGSAKLGYVLGVAVFNSIPLTFHFFALLIQVKTNKRNRK